eukprot:2216556-Rhodomonas_salina.1
MVDICVDDLSRAVAKSLHDVSLSPSAFSLVCSLAEAYLGGQPTVNWLASAATAQLPVFALNRPYSGRKLNCNF